MIEVLVIFLIFLWIVGFAAINIPPLLFWLVIIAALVYLYDHRHNINRRV